MKKDGERFNLIVDKKYLSIFLILFLSIFLINQIPLTKATFQDNTSLQQIAYDCGGIFNATNGVYRMNQSITAAGTCFTISAQNITLDCNGNTVTYSTAGAASTYGITTNQFSTTIKNCKIIDGNWTLTAPATRYGIYTLTQGNNTIYNNTVNVSNSAGIYFISSQWNNLTGNRGFTNSSTVNLGGIRLDSGNNTLTNNLGISTSISSGIILNGANNNNLISNNATSNTGIGIYLTSASNNTLINNNGTSTSSKGIYLSSSQWNNLTGNMGFTNSSTTNDGGIRLDSGNNTLTNNTGISTSSTPGIILTTAVSSSNTLINNNGTSNSSHGIYLLTTANNTLINNTGTSNTGVGIYVVTSQWNNLTGNTGRTNSATTNYGGIRLDSGNNTLTNNTGISTSSTPGIILTTAVSSSNTLINNNGTSNSSHGIYLLTTANNTLINNTGTANSIGTGIFLSASSNNTLINNNGTSNSSYGIYLSSSNNNTFSSDIGLSSLSYGFYWDGNCTNNTFFNFVASDPLSVSIKTNLNQTLKSAILNSSCVTNVSYSSVSFSYEKTDESSWQTYETNRTQDIYAVGDSITAANTWQKSLDAYMGSNSQLHTSALGGEKCYQTYGRYLTAVTNNSNATVVVFCGINDARGSVALANTTYYLEAMYNLSVARNQSIIFVNSGVKETGDTTCSDVMAINNWLSDFTTEKGVPLVDFHSLMSTNSSGCYPNSTVTTDNLHPNDYGYRLLGKLIWEQGFNSSVTFALNKPLAHFDQGKTYDIKCTSNDDGNIFQMYYTLPASFTSGGGIIDNASTLNTTLTNVTAKINESSYNSSSVYYDSTLINITSDTSNLEFNYNFSKYDFNFTSVSIDNETVGDKKFLSIWGIAEDGVVGTKSMKIYNANTAYNSVCVKDEENVTSISAACTDTNETKVLCDSNSHSGYVCSISGTTLTITGLKHSGVMQMYQDVSVAAAEDNSGSGPGSFNPSNQTLENGYNANVAKDDKINFKFNNETKTILIEKVSADNVEFSIDNKDYSVQENQTMKIDLNSDGYYDIQIFLKSIYSGRAILEVKLINEKIPAEEQASSQEQNKTENTPEKKSNYKWIFIAAGVLILAFVIKLFFNKKYEKKFGKKWR